MQLCTPALLLYPLVQADHWDWLQSQLHWDKSIIFRTSYTEIVNTCEYMHAHHYSNTFMHSKGVARVFLLR